MGAVAKSVGDFGSQLVETVFEPVKQIGNVTDSIVREVGHAAESVGREIGKVGQAAVNDPVGTIAKVAAIATQQYWALPLISAATVVAHGGDLGQAALAAGISYAGSVIAAGVGDYLGAGSSASIDMAANDASSLVNQGLSSSQVSEILKQSYNLSPEIANNITAQTILGNTASQITSDITSQMATQNLLASAAGNTVGGATRSLLSGGSGSDILTSALASGTGTLAGGYTAQELKDLGINNTVANVLGKATGAATASQIGGKDAKLSFINSLINTTLSEGGKQVGSGLKTAWNEVNDSASKFNTQLNEAKDTFNSKLAPLEQDARTAQEVAAKSFDEYKPIRDQFSDLVKQYDEAKAAGNTELANSLADQANALIPSLNAATDKYNADVAAFDTKLAAYDTATQEYKAQTARLDEAKKEYDDRNQNLKKTTEEFTNTALKVADMGDNAKSAFQTLYNNGNSLTTSFDTVSSLDKLSDVAQGSFMRQYGSSQDPAASLDFANKINALDTNAQASYAYAVNTGLDDNTALKYAPNLSGMSKEGQQVFLDGIKSGQDPKAAETSAALAEFFKQSQMDLGPKPAYAPTASTNTTGSMTDVGGSSTPLVPVQIGTQANSTFVYNPKTGQFDIPVPDTVGGQSGATSIAPTESTGTGVVPFTDAQKAAADKLDQQLANGEITQEQYDARAKEIEANVNLDGTKSSTNIDVSGAVNNPNLVDNTFTGTSPVSTQEIKVVENATSPTGYSDVNGNPTDKNGNPVARDPNAPQVDPGNIAPSPGTGTGGTNLVPLPSPGTGSGGTGGTGAPGSGTGGTGTGGTGTVGTGGIGSVGTGGTGTGGTSFFPTTGMYNYGTSSQDAFGGIKNLTPGLTQKLDYSLTGMPNIQESTSPIPQFATGSSVNTASADPFNTGIGSSDGISSSLKPGLTTAQINYILTGMPGANIVAHADGGSIEGHNPSFFSEGGLSSLENRYVQGEGDGTSDSVEALLANGEFVIPADVVSDLGNGSNEAGASILDQFLVAIRQDKHPGSDGKLPKDSKGPLAYLLDAKRNVKA